MRCASFSSGLFALCVASSLQAQTSYHVSPNGHDGADGLTPATAWRTAAKVNATSFAPGSQILFERGGEWREQLSASSSGTVAAPITYGAYGSGPKPKFWGSDVIDNAGFSKIAGTDSMYGLGSAAQVNAVLADHSFYRSAALVTRSADPAVQRAFVDSTPNSWAYDGGTLYVNTGGVDPGTSPTTFTAAVRDDLVYSNYQSNLVFRDLVVDESAKQNAGYAFRVMGGENVRIENSEAYRAGKHHFGVINSGGFVAKGLYTSDALPDQGYGGATAYVAFSDGNQSVNDNSQWIDCVAENNGGVYPAFFTHGTGVGDILIRNMTVRGGPGITIGTEAPYPQNVRIEGGHLENAGFVLYGQETVVDGVLVTGPDSHIELFGHDNVIRNMIMTGAKPSHSYFTAIMDRGRDNTIEFNTILLDPTAVAHATALALLTADVNTRLERNIIQTPDAILRQWFQGPSAVEADFNLYSAEARMIIESVWATMDQWRAMGHDPNTLLQDVRIIDGMRGPIRYVDDVTGEVTELPYGAFAVPEPATGAVAMFAAGAFALLRRRRAA